MKYFLFLLALLLIPLVAAEVQTSSFDAWITSSTTCACAPTQHQLHLFNSGAATTYTITIEGEDALLASWQQEMVMLEAGEQRSIILPFHLSCQEKELSYVVHIESALGDELLLEKTQPVVACSNIAVGIIKGSAQADPCQPLTYELLVQNTGSFTETYSFLSSRATFTPERVIISPGKEELVETSISLSCETYGDHQIPLRIQAEQSQFYQDTTLFARVNHNYDFSLQALQLDAQEAQVNPYTTCIDTYNYLPVRITNNGAVENSYTLKSSEPLSTTHLSLGVGQSQIVYVAFHPSVTGGHAPTLLVSSDLGDITKGISLPSNANLCFMGKWNVPSEIRLATNPTPIQVENVGSQTLRAGIIAQGPASFTEDSLVTDDTTSVPLMFDLKDNSAERVLFLGRTQNGETFTASTFLVAGNPLLWNYRHSVAALVGLFLLLAFAWIIWFRMTKDKREEKRLHKRAQKLAHPLSKRTLKAIDYVKALFSAYLVEEAAEKEQVTLPETKKKTKKVVVEKNISSQEKKSFAPLWISLGIIALLLLLLGTLFFLPLPTLMEADVTGVIDLPSNQMTRLNPSVDFGANSTSVRDADTLRHFTVGDGLYVWGNEEGSNRLIVGQGFYRIDVVAPINLSVTEQGKANFITANTLLIDLAMHPIVWIVGAILLIILVVGLVVYFLRDQDKSLVNKSNTKQNKQ